MWIFCSQKTIFYSQVNCFTRLLITIDWNFDNWDRKQNLYLEWIALHCSRQIQTFFNFRKIANRGNEENYIILLLREARTSYLRMTTPRVGKHFKKRVLTKILLLISFVFYNTQFLEKRAENSGVLLNCYMVALATLLVNMPVG